MFNMPTVKELKASSRQEMNGGVFGDWAMHNSSFYLVKLLLYTKLTPNQITLWGIVFGLFGVVLIGFSSSALAITGYIIMLFYWLTDYSDGKVARYRNVTSLRGKYYDYLGHLLVSPAMFLAVGVHLFNLTGNPWMVLLGALTTLFFLYSDVNPKFPRLLTGKRHKQEYQVASDEKVSFFSLKNIKGLVLKAHKNITFCVHLVIVFLITELIILFNTNLGINITFYALVVYMVLFFLTFIRQIFDYSKRIEKHERSQ